MQGLYNRFRDLWKCKTISLLFKMAHLVKDLRFLSLISHRCKIDQTIKDLKPHNLSSLPCKMVQIFKDLKYHNFSKINKYHPHRQINCKVQDLPHNLARKHSQVIGFLKILSSIINKPSRKFSRPSPTTPLILRFNLAIYSFRRPLPIYQWSFIYNL
eukprot:NODE_173_length_14219_cov_0.603824.p10 type:complete len:157 gc:universal NODE_173_length_14219_cov_0.603824:2483-2013(-)